MDMAKQLELLAPAGTLAALKAVVYAGADAVYFGGSRFSARAYADNLSQEEVMEAIDFGHIHGKKMILAINTLLKETEMQEQLYEYLLPFYRQGLDAVIVQDFGVMQWIRRNFPGLLLHTSTQMTVAGAEGAKFLADAGASRIVLARELTLEEIRHIHESVPVELEGFVHGALCYSYSGQCLFSSLLGGRSGNRGRCAQPCRLPYDVYRADGQKLNDRRHTYPLSLKDLCTAAWIPRLAESGITSFKIEGRMKQAEYAAGVVSVYRQYLDRYLAYGKEGFCIAKEDQKKLLDLGNRSGFTEGYYQQWNGPNMVTFDCPGHQKQSIDAAWQEYRIKLSGRLTVQNDQPMELSVLFGGAQATVTGDVPKPAQKQPLTEETLREKMMKTKNTWFTFETLHISLGDGLFAPVSALNDLRRRALECLRQTYLAQFLREAPVVRPLDEKAAGQPMGQTGQTVFTASVETVDQLPPLLENRWISVIYLDSMAFPTEDVLETLHSILKQAKAKQKQVYYILPAIFRERASKYYKPLLSKLAVDGFLVKNYDALSFLLRHGVRPERIRIDHSLYTWSTEAKAAFFSLGIAGDTVPLELNQKEIGRRDNTDSEMLVYGYLPLMVSAQCVKKNVSGCSHMPEICYLKDRYGVSFPVKNNCMQCYNVIYNSRPLYLLLDTAQQEKLGVRRFRLSFTIESVQQVQAALDTCLPVLTGEGGRGLPAGEKEYTYGHLKRGVE